MINILITSAGSTPAQILAKNIIKDDRVNKIILTDIKSENSVPTLYIIKNMLRYNKNMYFYDKVKFYQVSNSTNKNYPNEINNICKKENINLVIPILNEDILYLHTKVPELMITNYHLIFCDKHRTSIHFKINNIPHPKVYKYNEFKIFPIIVKPCIGTGGLKNIIIYSEKDFHYQFKNIDTQNVIIQQYIQNSIEYTTDIVCNKQSKILGQCTRKRISTRNGLCMEAETVNIKSINELTEKICNTFKFYGQINIQYLIKNDESNKIYVLEINPRSAGSAAISYEAGMPISQMIIDAYLNINRTYLLPKIGMKMLRYWSEVYL